MGPTAVTLTLMGWGSARGKIEKINRNISPHLWPGTETRMDRALAIVLKKWQVGDFIIRSHYLTPSLSSDRWVVVRQHLYHGSPDRLAHGEKVKTWFWKTDLLLSRRRERDQRVGQLVRSRDVASAQLTFSFSSDQCKCIIKTNVKIVKIVNIVKIELLLEAFGSNLTLFEILSPAFPHLWALCSPASYQLI